jgi:hydroxymethylpyrimidine/phosphomethylpyrimidine kinase
MTDIPERKRIIENSVPKVLLLSGLDPSGGAGLQADILTCGYFGCHSLPIMTINTVQDTGNVHAFKPEDPAWIKAQLRQLLQDIVPDAVKIGALGDEASVAVICEQLQTVQCPIIYDPVLRAGGGGQLSKDDLLNRIREQLLSKTFLCTPNSIELMALTGIDNELDAIEQLTQLGCRNILITGGHDLAEHKSNRLYTNGKLINVFPWEQIPGEYRGTGCSMATAIAATLARGHALDFSCLKAIQYLSTIIGSAYTLDFPDSHPKRSLNSSITSLQHNPQGDVQHGRQHGWQHGIPRRFSEVSFLEQHFDD